MKSLPLLLVAACIFSGCSPSPKNSDVTAEDQTSDAPPAPAPAPQKTAAEQRASEATPEPVQNWTAPDGVYFMTRQTSLETPDGLVGLRPGTKVRKQADGRFITDDQRVVQLPPDSVTNDLRIAQRVAAQDQQTQAAIRQATAARPAVAPTPSPSAKTRTRAVSAAPTPEPKRPTTMGGTSLDKGAFGESEIRRRPR